MTLGKLGLGFWRNAFFYFAALFVFGLIIWQLVTLEPPTKWCPVDNLSVCYTALIRVLDIKDHALIGLLGVLGVIVVGSMVVSYRLNVNAGGGAEGFHVDIQQDHTTVQTPGGTVSVPTVPTAPQPPEAI